MKIAVIDFSSTSLSLLVEEVSGEMMTPIVGLRRSVSILGYMSKKGRLSERGIAKVVESIRYLIDAAENVGAESVHIISTASMRLIRNYGDVRSAVKEATGLAIVNLDGQSEAYAGFIANREYCALGNSLMLDVGGYSSSLADLDGSGEGGMHSLDIGPAALFQIFDGIYPSKGDVKKMQKTIGKALEKKLRDNLKDLSLYVVQAHDERNWGGMVCVYYPKEHEDDVVRILGDYRIHGTMRGGYIRFGLDFYNTMEQMDVISEALHKIAALGEGKGEEA